mmetsp:Transcript_41232/g.96689  ORF Transcript_41232/g.96689 Transcript_41232/m.96689 type:complete len:104 (-) Transcript_41232:539-850(-)
MTSILSPLAPSFTYENTNEQIIYPEAINDFSFSMIYNNGKPALVICGDLSAISGISDEAIEEFFPPSYEDLAEIQTVDNCTALLAALDYLEKKRRESENFQWR